MRHDTALYTAYTALFRFLFAAAMSGLAMSGIAKPVSAQMVHVITVADSHSDLSGFVIADEGRFLEVMTDGLGENHINRVYLRGSFMNANTPQNILNTLHHLENVGANDAVVFYYTGHGAWDKQKELYYAITSPADAAPHFQPEPERNGIMKNTNLQTRHLLKSDVVEAIQKHRPRLTVVISDCCSSYGQYIPSEAMEDVDRGWAERIKPLRPLFRKLFFKTTGLVDFCAAQEGRAGYSYTRKKTEIHSGRKFVMNDPGSAMTFALTDAMNAYKGRTMDWASLFVIVQDQTRKNANTNTMDLVKRDLRDIGKEDLIKDAKEVSQYPLAFSLGNRAAAARGSGIKVLGMNVETRQEGGVAVSKVIPKTAATKAGFEVKDVITKVNGKTVNSKEEFDAAVADSGTVVNFTVIDQRTNKETIFPMSIYLPSE